MKMPNLPADADKWAEATKLLAISIKDIPKIFGVSKQTAVNIINTAYKVAEKNGQPIYQAGSRKAVPIEFFVELYGYDFQTILKRSKYK